MKEGQPGLLGGKTGLRASHTFLDKEVMEPIVARSAVGLVRVYLVFGGLAQLLDRLLEIASGLQRTEAWPQKQARVSSSAGPR